MPVKSDGTANDGPHGQEATDSRRAGLVHAFDDAAAKGDVEGMADAALALAAFQRFGFGAGRVPAFLHQAYDAATGRRRIELAIAIARTWSYSGSPERAQPFVDEALASAESGTDPPLLAAALDAQLLTKWGPDEFADRVAITSRLEIVVAHVSDVEVRMNMHLWRLTTALECLDVATLRRQLRGLESLAEETGSPRVRFFAASRRAMHALLVGDVDLAARAKADAVSAGNAADEADTYAVERALAAAIARQRGDTDTAAREAAIFEEFGTAEGVISICAEAAQLWNLAGDSERARRLLHESAGADFSAIPRGVDWLFTLATLTEVAARLGEVPLVERARKLLEPYAGRGVVDAGAVGFAGVVDDYLAIAAAAVGASAESTEHRQRAADLYRQLGAGWWLRRVVTPAPEAGSTESTIVLRPVSDDSWEFGGAGKTVVLRDLKGFHYLRLLLQRPWVDVPARDLSAAVAGHPGQTIAQSSLGPVLDRTGVAQFRRRLADLDEEIEDSRDAADCGRTLRLEHEREALISHLGATTGLSGRDRSGSSTDERARVAVRKAVATAIDRLRAVDAPLARLLEDTVSTGFVCRYEPDPGRDVTWQLDRPREMPGSVGNG